MNKSTLYIVGTGLNPDLDTTNYGIEIIRKCELCITINPNNLLINFINKYNKSILDLSDMYLDHVNRINTYHRISEIIISHASNKLVGYITYGNPCVFDSICLMLQSQCNFKRIDMHVVSSLSFADKFFEHRQIFTTNHGQSVLHCSCVAIDSFVPLTMCHTIFAQIVSLSDTIIDGVLAVNFDDLSKFTDILTFYYGPSHKVELFDYVFQQLSWNIASIPLATLPMFHSMVTPTTSIYVPPLDIFAETASMYVSK